MAQRLPTNVRPEHYTLHLTPDLDKATFSGEETIDVTLAQAADSITLNAAEIQFQSVTANAGKRDMKADVSLDADEAAGDLHVSGHAARGAGEAEDRVHRHPEQQAAGILFVEGGRTPLCGDAV